MLVAVRYLGNDTITGINQIEDWHLPKGAFKTQFTDAAGRFLYLVGTPDQVKHEAARMDKKGATLHHYGYTFTYRGEHQAPAKQPVAFVDKHAKILPAKVDVRKAPSVETKTTEIKKDESEKK